MTFEINSIIWISGAIFILPHTQLHATNPYILCNKKRRAGRSGGEEKDVKKDEGGSEWWKKAHHQQKQTGSANWKTEVIVMRQDFQVAL